MKYMFFYLFMFLLNVSQGQAEENYWQHIKPFVTDAHPKMGKAESIERKKRFRAYMDSLNADQLILASRQCAREYESLVPRENWQGATIAFGFFWQEYPRKTNGLQKIDGLLNDLKDKSREPLWRLVIMQLLGTEWHDKIDVERGLLAARTIQGIFYDSSEQPVFRIKACSASCSLLLSEYIKNIIKDVGNQKFCEFKRSREAISLSVQNGQLKLSDTAMKKNQEIIDELHILISKQVELFSESKTDQEFKKTILGLWMRINQVHLTTPAIERSCRKALEMYQAYDENLWSTIIMANREIVNNPKVKETLEKMIKEAKINHVRYILGYQKEEVEREKKTEGK